MSEERYIQLHEPDKYEADRYPPIGAITVWVGPGRGEEYRVGFDGVTEIRWNLRAGETGLVPSVVVFRNGKPHSEHYARKLVGIYFDQEKMKPIKDMGMPF